MATDDERFLQRLLATFRLEADEHVGAMSALVLELERPGDPARAAGLVETLFREVHSLKGAARAVNLADIEAVCQALESVLALLKRAQRAPPAPMFELLYLTIDVLRGLLDGGIYELGGLLQALMEAQYGLSAPPAAMGTAPPMPPFSMPPMAAVSAMPVATAAPSMPAAAPEQEPEQTVRISTAKLTALLLQAEELLAFKFSAEHMAADLRALHGELEGWRKHWSRTVGEARAIARA
uniref:Hpt domain-containing protein n=1 Tax=Duganella sp. S19_KUP01_CR8 TaxID=3025502 RepID=UPI002FCDC9C9